jgi:hypothetical protein
VKLIALLSFFDERPDWLSATVASVAKCCDHVVAVDGAYSMFPQARPHCGDVQMGAVVATAQQLGLGVSYYAPQRPWNGEVEKRNHLFRLGNVIAEPEVDWFMIIDADMLVETVPSNLNAVLSETLDDVGTYWIREDFEGGSGRYPARFLFRAGPDLQVTRTHFGYRRGDTYLWETGGLPACQTDLVLEHRRFARHPDRGARADEYYRRRDVYGIENVRPAAELAS